MYLHDSSATAFSCLINLMFPSTFCPEGAIALPPSDSSKGPPLPLGSHDQCGEVRQESLTPPPSGSRISITPPPPTSGATAANEAAVGESLPAPRGRRFSLPAIMTILFGVGGGEEGAAEITIKGLCGAAPGAGLVPRGPSRPARS